MLHSDTLNGRTLFLEQLFDRHKHILWIWTIPQVD
jgi:hypothetical protein